MRINRRSFIVIELILLALVIVFISILISKRINNQTDKVFVIMKNTEENYRNALIYGMKKASLDIETDLVVVSAGDIATIEEEKSMIQREIENGADAIIVEPVVSSDNESLFLEFEKQVPILLINNSDTTEEEPKLPVYEINNYQIGYDMAERTIEDYMGKVGNKKFGIIVDDKNTEAGFNREKGCLKRIEEAGGEVVWSVSGRDDSKDEILDLSKLPKVDIVIGLDNQSTIEAGNRAEERSLKGAVVFGIANSTDAVYLMENRSVECLIVPDDFELGYESFLEVAMHLKNKSNKIKGGRAAYSVIRRYDLFSEDNQRILYTMSQ